MHKNVRNAYIVIVESFKTRIAILAALKAAAFRQKYGKVVFLMDMGLDMSGIEGSGIPTGTQNRQDISASDAMADGRIMGPDCFGASSARYADTLMEYINDEFGDYLYYSALSRRSPTASSKRLFRRISNDELRHSRRWAAAYFLITGKRYFPTRDSVEPVSLPATYAQALRERYLAESKDVIKYRTFSKSVSDSCLRRIAEETAEDEKLHAQEIMELIEVISKNSF